MLKLNPINCALYSKRIYLMSHKAIFYHSTSSPLFDKTNISFALTSRYEGKSLPPYESLNLAYHVGDKPINVDKNRKIIQDIFAPNKKIIWMNQTHSDIVLDVSIGENKDGFLGTADAMICSEKNLLCMVMVADCNPILIYDQKKQIFALIHAGREGLVKSIINKTIKKMTGPYQSKPQDMLVFVGASIRKCCYEISKDLALSFDKSHLIVKNSTYKLDLISLVKSQLKECNVLSQNIEILPTCSCCEESLFSYRREHITGRFALLATLK